MVKKATIIKTNISEGSIVVNPGASLVFKSRKVALVQLDTFSKRPVVGAFTSGDDCLPGIYLESDKYTLYKERSKKDTLVEFRGYIGWEVFSATAYRYTVNVTLVKGA